MVSLPSTPRILGCLVAANIAAGAYGADTRWSIAAGKHPRLYFWREDIGKLKAKAQDRTPSAYARVSCADFWRQVQLTADSWLNRKTLNNFNLLVPLNPPNGGPPYLDATPGFQNQFWLPTVRNTQTAVENMALAFLITGERKYADRALAIVCAELDWPKWWDSKGYQGAWLETMHLLFQTALVYDLLYDEIARRGLTRKFQQAIIEKGIKPCVAKCRTLDNERPNDSRGERLANKDSLMTGAVGAAALALLGDAPGMEQYVDFAVKRLTEWSENPQSECGLDGLSVEGPMYGAYAFSGPLRFAEALFHATSDRCIYDLTTVRNYPVALLYMTVGRAERVTDPDGFVRPRYLNHANWSAAGLRGRYGVTYLMLLEQRLHEPAAVNACRFLLRRAGDLATLRDGNGMQAWWRFVCFDPNMPPPGPPPEQLSKHFPHAGYAVMRTGWFEPDTIFFALRCGRMGCKNRASQNSFMFMAFGQWLVSGVGYDHRYDSAFHSTLVLDGQGQRPTADKQRLTTFFSPAVDYARGELVGEYPLPDPKNTFVREVAFVKPDYVLLRDTVRGAREFAWLVNPHGPGRAAQRATVERLDGRGFTLRNANVRLHVQFVVPRMRLVEFENPAKRFKLSRAELATYPVVIAHTPPRNDRRHELLTLLWPERTSSPRRLAVEPLLAGDGSPAGVRVRTAAGQDLIAFRPTELLSGNGRVLFARQDGSRFGLIDGVELRVHGQPWLRLGAQGSAGFLRRGDRWRGVVALRARADVGVRIAAKPLAVKLNGRTLERSRWRYDPSNGSLMLPELPADTVQAEILLEPNGGAGGRPRSRRRAQ